MMNQLLGQYPEFIVAVLLSSILLLKGSRADVRGDADKVGAAAELAAGLLACLPPGYRAWLSTQQYRGGLRSRGDIAAFASWKVYPSILSTLLAFLLPPAAVLLLVLCVFMCADAWLLLKVARRKREIAESLPRALDLLLLCVDAGLGLDAALQRVAGEQSLMSNELSSELTRLSKDLLLGMDREIAYADFYARTGVEEVRTLASALNQSQKLGLSISAILRAQADFLRNRQQKRAEEKAAKLPVWLAFPLWFCIMPALMLVLVGPSFLLFFHQAHPLPPGLWD